MNHHLAPIHCPLQRLKVLHVALRKSKFRIGQMLRKVPFPSRSQVVINRYRLDAVPSQQHIRKMRSNKPRAAHNKNRPILIFFSELCVILALSLEIQAQFTTNEQPSAPSSLPVAKKIPFTQQIN